MKNTLSKHSPHLLSEIDYEKIKILIQVRLDLVLRQKFGGNVKIIIHIMPL